MGKLDRSASMIIVTLVSQIDDARIALREVTNLTAKDTAMESMDNLIAIV